MCSCQYLEVWTTKNDYTLEGQYKNPEEGQNRNMLVLSRQKGKKISISLSPYMHIIKMNI